MGAVPARTDGDSLEGARWACAVGCGAVHLESLPFPADGVRTGLVVVRGAASPALFYRVGDKPVAGSGRPVDLLGRDRSRLGGHRDHDRCHTSMALVNCQV